MIVAENKERIKSPIKKLVKEIHLILINMGVKHVTKNQIKRMLKMHFDFFRNNVENNIPTSIPYLGTFQSIYNRLETNFLTIENQGYQRYGDWVREKNGEPCPIQKKKDRAQKRKEWQERSLKKKLSKAESENKINEE